MGMREWEDSDEAGKKRWNKSADKTRIGERLTKGKGGGENRWYKTVELSFPLWKSFSKARNAQKQAHKAFLLLPQLCWHTVITSNSRASVSVHTKTGSERQSTEQAQSWSCTWEWRGKWLARWDESWTQELLIFTLIMSIITFTFFLCQGQCCFFSRNSIKIPYSCFPGQ